MTIHFMFVLTWVIPELKGLSRTEIEAMVEMARQSSIPRIRKYAGWSFATSFFAPPIFFFSIFVKLNFIPGEMSFIFVGIAGFLSTLSGSLLTSLFNAFILKPAIYDQLNKRSRPSQKSA